MIVAEILALCEADPDNKPTTGQKIAQGLAKAAISLTPLAQLDYALKGKLSQKAGEATHKVLGKRKYKITYTVRETKSDGTHEIKTKSPVIEYGYTEKEARAVFSKKHQNEVWHIDDITKIK